MTLNEFKQGDIYKSADCIEIVDLNGRDLSSGDIDATTAVVSDYHIGIGGYLEITLKR